MTNIKTALQDIRAHKAHLIDVREKSEWDEGHFPNAINAPLSTLEENIASLPPGQLYIHCQKGRRAEKAADLLQKKGLCATSLAATYDELCDAGYSTDSD